MRLENLVSVSLAMGLGIACAACRASSPPDHESSPARSHPPVQNPAEAPPVDEDREQTSAGYPQAARIDSRGNVIPGTETPPPPAAAVPASPTIVEGFVMDTPPAPQ